MRYALTAAVAFVAGFVGAYVVEIVLLMPKDGRAR